MEFIEIQSVPSEISGRVKQRLKFKTGKFVWRIKFSAALDPSSVTNDNLYVTTTDGTKLKASIHYNADTQEIEIEPLEAYAKDASYILNISKNVKSQGGQTLKNDMQVTFKV